jgi:hypothetical protein
VVKMSIVALWVVTTQTTFDNEYPAYYAFGLNLTMLRHFHKHHTESTSRMWNKSADRIPVY